MRRTTKILPSACRMQARPCLLSTADRQHFTVRQPYRNDLHTTGVMGVVHFYLLITLYAVSTVTRLHSSNEYIVTDDRVRMSLAQALLIKRFMAWWFFVRKYPRFLAGGLSIMRTQYHSVSTKYVMIADQHLCCCLLSHTISVN